MTRPLAAAAAALLVFGLAACGDDDDDAGDDQSTVDDGATTTTAGSGEELPGGEEGEGSEITIVATNFEFTPAELTVAPGAEVYLSNEGSAPHTVTADEGAFDTGQVAGGGEGEFDAPTEPGVYQFHCDVHPAQMTGTLTVEG